MRLALSVFKDCISIVFDAADQFMIVEMDGSGDSKRTSEKFLANDPAGRALQLKSKSIDVLICGAISRPMQSAIISQGIKVHPFIRGKVHDIVGAYQNNQLDGKAFLLPGCRRRQRGDGTGQHQRARCRWR